MATKLEEAGGGNELPLLEDLFCGFPNGPDYFRERERDTEADRDRYGGNFKLKLYVSVGLFHIKTLFIFYIFFLEVGINLTDKQN